jgi:hypothetical protein
MRRRRAPQSVESKERDWRSPQRGHWEAPPVTQNFVSVNERAALLQDALEVDRVISGLPLAHRIILRAEYVARLDLKSMLRIARRHGGFVSPKAADVTAMLGLARAMLAKRLRLPAVFRQPAQRREPSYLRNTSGCETEQY